jgi:pimeloyl-ACP methyl ester carboxylesterase
MSLPTRDLDPVRLPDGRTLALTEVGDPHGSAAFYLHGTGSSRLETHLYAAAALEHGVRLIGWDRPGSGRSPAQPNRTVLDVVADARAVAAALGLDTVAAVGLSGGASHVLALTAKSDGLVRRGIAVNPGPPSDPAVLVGLSPTFARLIGLARSRPGLFRVVADVTQARGWGPLGRLAEAARRRSLDPADAAVIARPDVRPLMEAAALEGGRQPHAWREEALILWRSPWGVSLEHFPVPLDVFVGSDDAFRPFGEGLGRAGATVHVFPGGHVSGFVPEVMARVMAVAAEATDPTGGAGVTEGAPS